MRTCRIDGYEPRYAGTKFTNRAGTYFVISDHSAYLFVTITLTPYMVLPLFATRFADYTEGIRVSFIQPRLF